MKIYISADMEGIVGIANWDETMKKHGDYPPFVEEMQKEVQGACEGAVSGGAKEIWVKDAHGSGRNLTFAGLPINTKLIRAFSGHPFCMMEGIDSSFDGALMIGYHSGGGYDGNPLSHTLDTEFSYIKINGIVASEFLINAYTASYVGVPVLFVSGDEELSEHVKSINPNIKALGVNKGFGKSVISSHPDLTITRIKETVEDSLKGDLKSCFIPLPESFEVEISFVKHVDAFKASFYPGMKKLSPTKVLFSSNDYFEVLRMLNFM
jgi:D-amino peptidase